MVVAKYEEYGMMEKNPKILDLYTSNNSCNNNKNFNFIKLLIKLITTKDDGLCMDQQTLLGKKIF